MCVLCRLRQALALQIEAHPAGNKLHPADVSTKWHMCALNEQPRRTDQNFMQDKLVEPSVLGVYEHGTVVSTTATFSQ